MILHREVLVIGPVKMVWMSQNSDIKVSTLKKAGSQSKLAPSDPTSQQIGIGRGILKQNRAIRHFLSL